MGAPQTTDFEVLGPRFIHLGLHGKFTADEATAVFDAIEERVKDEPYFLLEVDMSDVKGASPESRRISAEKLGSLPPRAIAIVSQSFAQRMIAKLVLTAVSLLGDRHKNVSQYFSTQAEAHEWLLAYDKEQSDKLA
ncbi:MAG: STAS/SEC14 domain-containing protein [Myxococcota bacterium]